MDTKIRLICKLIVFCVTICISPSVKATDVGSPTGAFSVSPMGGAIYSLVIETPQGLGNMTPDVGVSYSSQSTFGIVGYGCNISGLSMITRAPKDIYHDPTEVKGISFENTDAFYLDGKRLILQSGTEGTDGATYAPEGEALTKVTLHTSTYNSNPTIWFEVKTNEGITYQYGRDMNQTMYFYLSSQYWQNAWYISRAEDQLGNYITYSYLRDNNYLYPSNIFYGYNSNGGGSYNAITFTYENDPNRNMTYYTKGFKVKMGKRLKDITTSHGNSTYRKYDFTYSSMELGNSTYSVLSSVTENNGDGNSLPPVSFNWQSASGYTQTVSHPSIPLVNSNSIISFENRNFFSADLNGDGFCDLIQVSPVRINMGYGHYSNDTYLYIYRSSFQKSTQTISYSAPTLGYYPLGPSFSTGDWSNRKDSPSILDFDGDGLNDVVIPSIYIEDASDRKVARYYMVLGSEVKSGFPTDHTFEITLSSSEVPCYTTADIDNDGKSDIVILEKNEVNNSYALSIISCGTSPEDLLSSEMSLSIPSTPQEIYMSDFDNNGLCDLMVVYDDGYKIYWNQTGVNSTIFTESAYIQGTNVSYSNKLEMGDFNGDGCADFLMGLKNYNTWFVAYGKGNGNFEKQQAGTFDLYDQSTDKDDDKMRCLIYDFNGDGRSDIVIEKAMYSGSSFSKTKAFWIQSTGEGFAHVKTATSDRSEDALASYYMLGDFSGSGRTELLNFGYDCYNGTNADVDPTLNLYRQSAYTAQSGKVTSVIDGMDNQTSITYASLINSGKYTPQSNAAFPMSDINLPINVVTNTVQTNGSVGNVTLSYEYGGLKAHLRGKGILGFATNKVTNLSTQDYKTVTLNNWDTKYFIPKNTETVICKGNLSETSSSQITLNEITDRHYFTYQSSMANSDIYNNITTLTRLCNADYGYVISENVSYGSDMYKNTSYSGYVKKGEVWLPQTITSTQKHEDDINEFCDITNIAYTNNGLKSQVVCHVGTGNKVITTNYTYDTTGNIITESTSGSGFPNLTKYYTYASNKRDLTRAYTSPATTDIYYSYDDWGNILTEEDKTNQSAYLTTTYCYDGWGRKTFETAPTGLTTEYSYGWGTSQSRKYYTYEKTAGRSSITTYFDARGREMQVTTYGKQLSVLRRTNTYNSQGYVSQVKEDRGTTSHTTTYNYDSWGRPTSVYSSIEGNTHISYGNRSTATTKNGQSYTKSFDAWGNVKISTDPISSVEYTYSSNGKPTSIVSEGNETTIEYDAIGNQTMLNDPSAGITTYTYDACHLLSLTDARGKTSALSYDNLGRLSQENVDGTVTSYTYGTSGNGKLRLIKKQTGNNIQQFTYDLYGRITTESRTVDGAEALSFSYTYNSYDQISSVSYPGSVTVGYSYDNAGCRNAVSVNGNQVWNIDTYGYDGSHLYANLNDSTTQQVNYDALGRIVSKNVSSMILQTTMFPMSFLYNNSTGNLVSRFGVNSGFYNTETFTYDNLDRLTGVTTQSGMTASVLENLSATLGIKDEILNQRILKSANLYSQIVNTTYSLISVNSLASPVTLTYDSNGNITSKTGLGNYSYSSSSPYAVTGVANTTGLVSTATQSLTYNGRGKILTASDNGYLMTFTYGPDDERWKSVLKQNGSTIRTSIYAGDYEKITEGGVTRQFYYLPEDIILVKTGNTAVKTYYAITDNLGSYVHIFDGRTSIVYNAEYDAWGQQNIITNTIGFHRGYTGHEMMPEFGLINMNGRLYDPLLGCFLSPDNYVQLPDFSQNFNRYSYCLNNPLKYTDPSGELFGIDDIIVGIGVAVIISGTANVVANWDEIHSFGHGLAMFGIGAASGALSIAGYPFAGAALMGGGNSILNQGFNNSWNNIDLDAVLLSTGMSVATYAIGSQIGVKYDNLASKLTKGISNETLKAGAHDAISGIIGGFTWGMGLSIVNGESIADAGVEGLKYGMQGAIFNGLNGLNRGWSIQKTRNAKIANETKENHYGNYLQYYMDKEGNFQQIDLRNEIDRIKSGRKYTFRHDGYEYFNKEGYFPNGEYTEWIVPTPGLKNRAGTLRIIEGESHLWFMPNHHKPPVFLIY